MEEEEDVPVQVKEEEEEGGTWRRWAWVKEDGVEE